MKKNIKRVLATVLVLTMVLTNASAIVLEQISQAEEYMLESGLSREAVDNILAILYYTDEMYTSTMAKAIMEKRNKLGSWEAAARSFGVEESKFHHYVENKVKTRAALTIPDPIYYEMIDSGMNDDKCREFGIRASRLGLDIEAAWNAHKNGESLEKAAERYKSNMGARTQAAIDLLLGEISDAEYMKKMREIAPELNDDEIIAFVDDTAEEWVEERVSTVGISAAELEMGAQIGFTSPRQIFELCRMKSAEGTKTLSFAEMLELVKNGESVEDIVKGKVSQKKIDALRAGESLESDMVQFTDLGNHAWASEAIKTLALDGIVKGTSETTFSPSRNITRADFAILLVRALKFESNSAENFSDVAATDYFAKELAVARNSGIVSGIGENRFAPRNFITRMDMMVIAYRALEMSGTRVLPVEGVFPAESYPDYGNVKSYATDAVKALVGAGIVNGKNGTIAPSSYTTRAEVAVLIDRMLKTVAK